MCIVCVLIVYRMCAHIVLAQNAAHSATGSRSVPNPKGFKRTRDELPIQTRFHKVLPAAVCALFARRGMDVGMRPPPVGGEDRDEILQEVCPLPYVYRAYSVCALFS